MEATIRANTRLTLLDLKRGETARVELTPFVEAVARNGYVTIVEQHCPAVEAILTAPGDPVAVVADGGDCLAATPGDAGSADSAADPSLVDPEAGPATSSYGAGQQEDLPGGSDGDPATHVGEDASSAGSRAGRRRASTKASTSSKGAAPEDEES